MKKAIIEAFNNILYVPIVVISIKIKTSPKKNAVIMFPKNMTFLKTGVYSINKGILPRTMILAVEFK